MKTKKIKAILAIGLLVLIALLAGCATMIEDKVAAEDYLNIVTLEEVIAKVDNGETFNFIIGNDACPACIYYKEELVRFHNDEDYKFDYMEYDSNTNRELLSTLLMEKLGDDSKELSTPTTYFIVNGELKDKIVGAIGADEIKAYSGYYK